MRTPAKRTQKPVNVEAFLQGAEHENSSQEPWKRGLSKKYDKATGKTINVRLPEHYAQCLEWLAEQDNRSQHGELVHMLCAAIDEAVKGSK